LVLRLKKLMTSRVIVQVRAMTTWWRLINSHLSFVYESVLMLVILLFHMLLFLHYYLLLSCIFIYHIIIFPPITILILISYILISLTFFDCLICKLLNKLLNPGFIYAKEIFFLIIFVSEAKQCFLFTLFNRNRINPTRSSLIYRKKSKCSVCLFISESGKRILMIPAIVS
jgi:hypothetical protein